MLISLRCSYLQQRVAKDKSFSYEVIYFFLFLLLFLLFYFPTMSALFLFFFLGSMKSYVFPFLSRCSKLYHWTQVILDSLFHFQQSWLRMGLSTSLYNLVVMHFPCVNSLNVSTLLLVQGFKPLLVYLSDPHRQSHSWTSECRCCLFFPKIVEAKRNKDFFNLC